MEANIIADLSGAKDSFGAMAPTKVQERVRKLAQQLSSNYAGRKLASLLLGFAGGRSDRGFDVVIFDTQKARLYPGDNICEKRVFLTPQHWDHSERQALAAAIAAHDENLFYFLDVGANVGLYSLFARAAAMKAGKRLRAVCVEADPEMRARAQFNVAASGAGEDIIIMPYAAAAENSQLRFSINPNSRGMSHIDEAGETLVEGRTLLSLVEEASYPRVDAMKVDIEGHEYDALNGFLETAPENYWPRFVILETSHENGKKRASALFEQCGYRLSLKTQLNSIFGRH